MSYIEDSIKRQLDSKNMIDDMSQKAADASRQIQNMHNEANSLRGQSDEIDKILDSLKSVSSEVKELASSFNTIKNLNMNIDSSVAINAINQFNSALLAADDNFNTLMGSVGKLSTYDQFKEKLTEISQSIGKFNDDLGMSVNRTQSSFQDINQIMMQTQRQAGETQQSLQNATGSIGNMNRPTDNSFSLLFKAISNDFEKAKQAIVNSNDSLEQQFAKLQNIGSSASKVMFGDGFMPQLAEQMKTFMQGQLMELERAFNDVEYGNIRKNPEIIGDKFKTFANELLTGINDTNNKIIKEIVNNLPTNTLEKLSSEILSDTTQMYSKFDENYKALNNLGNHLLLDLQAQASKGVDGANDTIKVIKQKISEMQTARQEMILGLSETRGMNLGRDLTDAQNPESVISKRYNIQHFDNTINKFKSFNDVSQYADSVNRSASVLQDRLDADPTMKARNIASVSRGVNFEKIAGDAREIDKLFSVFNRSKDAVISDLTSAVASGDDKRIKSAKKEFEQLIELSKMVNSRVMGMASSINVSRDDIKNVTEAKNLVTALNAALGRSKGHYKELYEAAKVIGMDKSVLDDIQKMNSGLSETQVKFNNLLDSSKSFGQSLKGLASDFFAPLSTLSKAIGFMGVSGLPLGLSGLGQYWNRSTDYYKNQALWREQALQAEVGMGDIKNPTINFQGADFRVYDQAMHYQKLSNGLINFQDYNNSYMNLVKGVGGQIGAGDSKTISDLNKINDNTFAATKLYGISDGTMQEFTRTFYKDLRQSADEVSYSFTKISQAATTANIPVEQYMKIVTRLASQYRSIGIDGNVALGVMDKFISQGMNERDAQAATASIGQGVANFAKNDAQVVFGAMMSGQSMDMYNSLARARRKFDANGNPSDEWANFIAGSIDANTNTMGMIGAGSDDTKWTIVYDYLKNTVGVSDERALQKLSDEYTFGDKNIFKDLLKKEAVSPDKEKTVVLENQAALEKALGTLGAQLSEASKIEAQLARAQYDLAYKTAPARDALLEKLGKSIEKLTTSANTLIGTISNAIEKIANSKIGGGILDTVTEHPLAAIGIMGGLYAGSKVASGALRGAGKGIAGKIFGKGGTKVAGEAAETATKGTSLLSRLTKSKSAKIATVATAATAVTGGALWLGNKFFGGKNKGDELSSTEQTLNDRVNATQNLSQGERDIADIKIILQNKFTTDATKELTEGKSYTPSTSTLLYGDTTGTTPSIISNATSNQTQSMNTNGVIGTPGSTPISGLARSDAEYYTLTGVQIGSMYAAGKMIDKTLGTKAITKAATETVEKATVEAAEKAAEKATQKAAGELVHIYGANGEILSTVERAAKGGVGKLTTESIEKTTAKGGEKLLAEAGVKIGGKTIAKGVLGNFGAGIIADAIFNYGEAGYDAVKGKGLKEDWGKASAGFLTDASWTATGTALGAGVGALFGGVGAIPGALVGGIVGTIAEQITDAVTTDKSGKGIVGKFKDKLTEKFTGKSEDEIELMRMIKYGGDKSVDKYIGQSIQTLGVTEGASKVMVNALEKHADKISHLNNEDKYNWALMYSYAKTTNPNASEKDILKELDTVFGVGNEKVKKEITSSLDTSISEGTGKSVAEVKKSKEDIIQNITLLQKQQKAFEDKYNKAYEDEKEKIIKKLGISEDEYEKAKKDKDSGLYKKIKTMEDKAKNKAKDEGEKALNKFNKEGKETVDEGVMKAHLITDDYGELAKVASGKGKTRLSEIFSYKDDLKKDFIKDLEKDLKKRGIKMSGLEKRYITGEYLTEDEKKLVSNSARAQSLKQKYQTYMGNAYSLKGFEDTVYDKIDNKSTQDKYIEFYKTRLTGTEEEKYKDRKDPLYKNFEKFLKNNENLILANTYNTQKAEDIFQKKMLNDLTEAIKTGDSDTLDEYKKSYKLSGESKNVLDSINGNILKLVEKGYISGDKASTTLGEQTNLEKEAEKELKKKAKKELEEKYDKDHNVDSTDYKRAQNILKNYPETTANMGKRNTAQAIVDKFEEKYGKDYQKDKDKWVKDQMKVKEASGAFRIGKGGSEEQEETVTAPVQGKITGKFGEDRGDHAHEGIDYGVGLGTDVKSVYGGTVTNTGVDPEGYGIYADVTNSQTGLTERFAHLSNRDVQEGQSIEAGQIIGQSGNTGKSKAPHLHYEIRNASGAIDPNIVLNGEYQGSSTINMDNIGPTTYDQYFNKYGKQYNIDPVLLKLITKRETGGSFNPNLTGSSGEYGLMQLMPGTWKGVGSGDPYNPQNNIEAGTEYFSQMLAQFKGDKEKAVAAYNAGPRTVENAIKNYKDDWKNHLPSVTQDYLKEVFGAYGSGSNFDPGSDLSSGLGSGSGSTGYDPLSAFGTSSTQFSEQMKVLNTPFSRGTLFHGILPSDYGKSSYSSGDSTARFNHLGNMRDLLNAGGDLETFSINVQAISKSLRSSMDSERAAMAKSQGRDFYDQFTANIGEDNSSSIYKTGDIYKPSLDAINSLYANDQNKNSAVIGISVVNQNNIDSKELAQRISNVLSEMGVTAKIEEVSSGIDGLYNSMNKTISYQNNANTKQY